MALFKTRTRAPDPEVEAGLAEIATWETWFRNAWEDILNDNYPDQHGIAAKRAEVDALATAVVAKMREDFLVRTRKP